MELYGSLHNISGSVTASAFTGSFIGDGSGLTGIQASGVTGLNLSQISNGDATASISTSGFTVNKNTQIQGNLSVTGALIATEYIVSSSVTYMTTSFASGSSAFGNDNNDVHQFTGSVQITGSISLNGQAIGTGKLDETTFQSYTSSNNSRVSSLETSSGSLNSFTSSINTTIKSKLDADNVISGSIQVALTGTTGYSTFSSSISTSIADVSSSVATTTSGLSSSIGSLSSSVSTTTSGLSSSIGELSSSVATTTSGLSSSIGSVSSSVATTTSNLSSSIGSLSSSIATTDLNQSNRLDSIEGKSGSYATTGSNLFKGTQTLSGSILPSVDNTYDLGSAEYQWRDVYISSGSLYIDGTKVLSSTTQELTITTDNGQSIKILESGTDSIILQTADGDIELKSNADGDILLDPTNGKILLKGTVEVLNGNKIQSSVGGTPVVFASDIVVSGSIDITGTIEGINLTDFSSSVSSKLGSLESTTGSLNSYTSSNTTNISAIHTATSSLNSFTSSINTTIKSKLDADGVISGSAQVILTGTTGYSTFSSSISSSVGSLSGSIATTTSGLSSSIDSLSSSVATTTSGLTSTITSLSSSVSSSIGSLSSSVATTTSGISSTVSSLSSSVATTTSGLSSSIGSLSSSVATTTSGLSSSIGSLSSSVATTTSNIQSRATSIESKTGSYATTGSNVFQGDQTITGSLYISQNLIIAGSSSIQNISSSVLNIADNIITVNAINPSVRFGGLAVIDSGSSPQVSGSMLFDSVNNQWLFVHQNQGTITSSVLLMGPETYNDLGNESYITANRLVKSTGIEHLAASNISDDGTTVTILSNTVINGTITSTGTTIVSGSSQISHDSTTGYVANRHIDHTSVSISAGNGLSGGGDISATRTVTLDTGSVHFLDGVKKELNTEGVISGSAQVVASLPSGTVSGSSQVLSGTGIWSGSAQLPSGVVSGSSQVLSGTGIWSGSAQLPSGVVSGSSQVLAGTTIHSGAFFNGISVVSGSSQISFNGITDKPTLVSGSSQITYGSLSGIPSGIVSGSSQITFGSISSIPGGLVSGSSQIDLTATTNYSTGIKTRLNAEGVVSGSAQITLSSTTGYGSVLNQAVLTTSSPTFAGITNNGAYSGSGGLFSHNIGNPSSTTELFVHNGANTPVPFRMTKAGYTGAGGSYGILQLYMNDNTNGNGANLYFCANSSNGTFTEYGGIGMQIKSNTAGSATARLYFYRQERGVNGSFDSNGDLYTVSNIYTNGNGTTTGNLVLNSSNYTSYSPTLTGGGASGTWGISISGNASTATTASSLTSMNISQFTNNSGYITGISFANVSSKPTTLSGYGITDALSNNADSEQDVGTRNLYYNDGVKRVFSDPRWNESGYDGDLGTLHIYSTTAAGANYGRAGIALYNGSAYQYITTRSGQSQIYINNNVAIHAGNFTSYAMSGAGFSANQNLNTSSGVRFATAQVGSTNSSAGLLNVNGATNNQVNITYAATGWGLLLGYGDGSIGTVGYHGTNHAAIINVQSGPIHLGTNNSSNVQVSTAGHFHPSANNTYDCGTASLAWRNVYTNDLHLSNMNKPEGNDVDGTNGNWTIQEGAENLYIINNNNGKKFKISLEEII